MHLVETRRWRIRGPEMEGAVARWYARLRSSPSQTAAWRREAARLTRDLAAEVRGMGLGRFSRLTTTATLEMLRRRAYSAADFERLAASSPFGRCIVTTQGIGLEVRLEKARP